VSNKVQNIFSIFEKENSAPQTELNYHNSYTLLVAVILSAQATDKGVNIATKDLFEKYDSPQKILELGLDGLKHYVKTLKLLPYKIKKYNSNFTNFIR
jgi:endonuclease-3